MKTLFRVLFVLLLTSTLLWAGDFWEDKEFTQWSEKDVEKLMTNSPWAKQVTVALSMGGRGGRGGGGMSGRGGGRWLRRRSRRTGWWPWHVPATCREADYFLAQRVTLQTGPGQGANG